MATREKEKKIIIEELSDIIAGKLLDMKPGTTHSIVGLVRDIYLPEGYDFIHLGPKIGYVWTKDGGKTFTITDWEQEDVLFQVKKKIRRKRRLDFSLYRGSIAGPLHNLAFVLRRGFL